MDLGDTVQPEVQADAEQVDNENLRATRTASK